MSSDARCTTCGGDLPAGAAGPCPSCLLKLGLDVPPPAVPEELGPYRIVSRIGEGGMGEVYRARDTRLDRDVAIKVLPDHLAFDPERSARFRREARVAASLNHRNVAAVYGFEEEDGAHFLVMELVEGITLAERLKPGPMPLAEALRFAAQLADGLEAAHESGVVHRDLKPGNIKITPSGEAKILDFGLAKGVDTPTSSDHAITGAYTSPGTVFGTAPYMSPEQARGRAVDKRSDIWSFGCVLYECLSGKRAFDGDTATDVVAKILERDPEWSALPARTPPRVRELLERCLEKDPKRRVRDMGDVRLELDRPTKPASWSLLPWFVAAAGVAVAVVALVIREKPSTASVPTAPVHVVMTDPDIPHVTLHDGPTVAVSPDGRTFAYTGRGRKDEGIGLYIRRADEIRARRLELPCDAQPGAQHVSDPFFSPDGRSLGFSCGTLYKMSLDGGTATSLFESAIPLKGATWSPAGIILSPAAKSGLVLVKEGGGPLETLTVPDAAKGEVSHRWPYALPDGRHVLFTVKKEGITTFDEGEIALLDLRTRAYTVLLRGGTYARYLPAARQIVFARGSSLMAVPLDLDRGEVEGQPVTVADGVMVEPGSGAAQYAVAQDAGTLVYVPGGANVVRHELAWIDRAGTMTPIGAPAQPYYTTYVSPDGTRLASAVFGATDSVAVYDLERGSLSRLTSEGNAAPFGWSPDGRQILYGSDRDGLAMILANADGSGTPRRLRADPAPIQSSVVLAELADGLGLVYAEGGSLWVTSLSGEETPKRLEGDLPLGAASLSLSHDGRWLAYTSDASGRSEVYVRPFPTGAGSRQISRGGGTNPSWSSQGEVFFHRDGWLCAARPGSPPVDLFKGPADGNVWGAHPDGRRLIFVRRLPPAFRGDRVEAILHWADAVRKGV